MERYYPLIDYKKRIDCNLNKTGTVGKDQVTDTAIEVIRMLLGKDISRLFSSFIHIYDFNKSKLREIKDYVGKKEYDTLAGLLRLPGVRLLRVELYLNSGVTLEILSQKTTTEIRNMVSDYIQKENRFEIIPHPKEVNCHREVARMILKTDSQKSIGVG